MTSRRLKHGRACICAECHPRRRLACGCIRYVEVCAEAVRLWDAVNDTHNEATRRHREGEPSSAELWQPFSEMLAAYEAHYTATAEPAEQALLILGVSPMA